MGVEPATNVGLVETWSGRRVRDDWIWFRPSSACGSNAQSGFRNEAPSQRPRHEAAQVGERRGGHGARLHAGSEFVEQRLGLIGVPAHQRSRDGSLVGCQPCRKNQITTTTDGVARVHIVDVRSRWWCL